ncbi:DUF4291 domain-containing protein [Chitinimonas sp.]|uniref:DUF4291 domain-containing protein n=1 Tax=Chitinimonas sp. TaxID=1934313 RepID=UPI0035B0F235
MNPKLMIDAPELFHIRASYTDDTIRVYQAYSDLIGKSALAANRFVSPPFKMDRMTWIKPSFLWMMYRAGWGLKDSGQNVILAIDIKREGFEWALAHACLSRADDGMPHETWQRLKDSAPVRIQWDPERDLLLRPQASRSIQIGLSKDAVARYVNDWIVGISDITPLAQQIHGLIEANDLPGAKALLPLERVYQPQTSIGMALAATA